MRSFLKVFLIGTLTIFALGGGVVVGSVWYLFQDLPPLTGLHEYQPSLVTRVYSVEKDVIGQFFVERRILELYLNQIYFGHGAYGVQAATQTYFNKDVGQLTLAEAAFLAGLPKGPSD